MTKELSIRSSSIPQLTLCPGALSACEGITSPDTAYSLEGTQNHLAMEAAYLGVEFDESRLTDSGSMLTRWFKKEMDGLIESHGGAKLCVPELALEHRLPESEITLTGHVDLTVICQDGTAIIADYKFGRLEVAPAPRNAQLMAYVWLFSKAAEDKEEFQHTHIDAYIFSAGSEKAFSGVRIKPEGVADIGKHLSSIVSKATDKDAAKRVPGEEQCRYCQAAGTDRCPESKEWVEQAAVGMELMATENAQLPADQQEVVRIYNAIKQVESFGKKFLSMLKAEVLADPEAWEGLFEPKPGNKVRSIVDVQAVYEKVVAEGGYINSEIFLSVVKLSIGDLEKMLKEPLKESGVLVKDQKAFITNLLGDLIEESTNKPSIKAVV